MAVESENPNNQSSGTQSSPEQLQGLEQIAKRVFQLILMFWTIRHKTKSQDPYDLTEAEFLTLDALATDSTCTVGDLQRHIAVQPAQMSRIVRSLENKADKPLINCSINPHDKRKIDVTVTKLGKQVHQQYQERRLAATIKLLEQLDLPRRKKLADILDTIHQFMSQQV